MICSYETYPPCTHEATHIVVSRNGTLGPFEEPVCADHLGPMRGNVYPGLIETRTLEESA